MKTYVMKTFLVLALLSSAGAIQLAASNDRVFTRSLPLTEEEKTDKIQMKTWVQSVVRCPDFIQDESGDNRVIVQIHTDANGCVHVDEVTGSNHRLCDYVKKSLEGKQLPDTGLELDKRFAIRFKRIAS